MEWPKEKDVGRYGDMSQSAHMRVTLDGDSDLIVSVWDDRGAHEIAGAKPLDRFRAHQIAPR